MPRQIDYADLQPKDVPEWVNVTARIPGPVAIQLDKLRRQSGHKDRAKLIRALLESALAGDMRPAPVTTKARPKRAQRNIAVAAIHELNRIGNNLNQAMRVIHGLMQTDRFLDHERAKQRLEDLDRLTNQIEGAIDWLMPQ